MANGVRSESKKIRSATDKIQKWLQDRRSWIKEENENEIQNLGIPKNISELAHFITCLDPLAYYMINLGIIDLIGNNELGWNVLKTGSLYYLIAIDTHAKLLFQPYGNADEFSLIALSLIYLNEIPLAETIVDVVRNRKHKINRYPRGGHLPQLTYCILLLSKKKYNDLAKIYRKLSLGPYRMLFDEWESDDGYAKALQCACKYHWDRMITGEPPRGEFFQPPFNIFPIEIYTINKLRLEVGLTVPEVNHPLLVQQLPLPKKSEDPNDEMPRLISKIYKYIMKNKNKYKPA